MKPRTEGREEAEDTPREGRERRAQRRLSIPALSSIFRAGPAAWVGPLLLIATGIALATWTWGAWPDPFIDFGRELYVPWQIASGQAVLYRDIAWFNGPLSPHVNALWFRLFGTGLRTLVFVNLALLAVTTALLYRLLAVMADRFAATLACLTFLLVFAFGQYVGVANYNYVCPYSHEVTHGLLLTLVSLNALVTWRKQGRRVWIVVSGLAVGLAFLTKAEPFLAALASGGVGLALFARDRNDPGRARIAMLWGGAVLLPVLGAFALLSSALGVGAAAAGVVGSWPYVVDGDLTGLPFYRLGMGLDRPWFRIGELAAWALGGAAILLPVAGLALLTRGRAALGRVLPVAVLVSVGGGLLWLRPEIDWLSAARPVPLFVVVIGLVAMGWRLRTPGESSGANAAVVAFSVAALVFDLKMILNTRVYHYGFVLAAPGTLLILVALTGWIPVWLRRRGANRQIFDAAVLALVAIGVVQHLMITREYLDRKTYAAGRGADRFRADLRGAFLERAVEIVDGRTPAGTTLAVLPEGVMLNYLTRRVNPTPYINFMPPEFLIFGEAAMLDALERTTPDWIALVHKDTREYGVRFFGRDFGRSIFAWIQRAYEPVEKLGGRPFAPETPFGVQLLRRKR